MQILVKVDDKWRIRLPKRARDAMKLTGRELLEMDLEDGKILIKRPSGKLNLKSPFMRDIIERPIKTDFVVTLEMINKLRDEVWNP